MKHFYVDGMLSGTGVRDAIKGGYIEPKSLGLSGELIEQLSLWQHKYEQFHFTNFQNTDTGELLDNEGIELTEQIRKELPNCKVDYFSNWKLRIFT